ncbi:hypothetical protein C0J52_26756 [Blattella germanica]|nr:hypothetical protein C0J52_26756 [Blattella germanica]
MIELERIARGGGLRNSHEERKFADIIKEKPIKVTIRVLVPVKEHPKAVDCFQPPQRQKQMKLG